MKSFRVLSAGLALVFCGILFLADTACAQGIGGAGGKGVGRGGRSGPKQKPPPSHPGIGGMGAGPVSSELCRIVKYTTADEDKDAELVGTLVVQPVKKGQKSVTVRVLKKDDTKLQIEDVSVPVDRFAEILTKGLYCNVGYKEEDEKKKSGPKVLTAIRFDPIFVNAKVEKIEGDVITLKGRPTGDREWPDVEENKSTTPPPPPPTHSGSGPKTAPPPSKPPAPKKVKLRTLKMKIIEDIAKLTDKDNGTIQVGDLTVGATVEAGVILSEASSVGIVARIKLTSGEETVKGDSPPTTGGGKPGKAPPKKSGGA